MTKTAVVALGGNALTRSGRSGTHAEQVANATAMAVAVCGMRDAGWNVVLAHGNGPRVGNLAIQQQAGAAPAGPFYGVEKSARLVDEPGRVVGEDAGRGDRRLVPSPKPVGIVELDAVIDKNRAAQRPANALGVDAFVLITDVARVMLDLGTPDAPPIGEITVDEAQAHADDDQFPEGSMGPKTRAAIQFLREGGNTAIVTDAARAVASLDPDSGTGAETGTRIVAADLHLGATP